MLARVGEYKLINLDRVTKVCREGDSLVFYCTKGVELYAEEEVWFEDESLLDKAFNRIISAYFYGHLICDITEYTK